MEDVGIVGGAVCLFLSPCPHRNKEWKGTDTVVECCAQSHESQKTTKEPTPMQKQRAFIQVSSSSVSHLHQRSGKMPEKENAVSPEQRFYGFPGRFVGG